MTVVVAPKARDMKAAEMTAFVAPKARDMKARGKRERSEARRPWISFQKKQPSPERAEIQRLFITALQALNFYFYMDQGRRASRLPLAIIFRAFGANAINHAFGANEINHAFGANEINHAFGANKINPRLRRYEANLK